jgi:hypothetical protein
LPSYENCPEYIELKKDLSDTVQTFMTNGLEIMKKWSKINIRLLTEDKCLNIM